MNNLHFEHWHCRIRRAAGGVTGVPPIHFGKEDSVERTLLMGACQSEVSVSAITLPKHKESKATNLAYSFSHLSGRRFRYASALDPGGIVAVLLRTLDR